MDSCQQTEPILIMKTCIQRDNINIVYVQRRKWLIFVFKRILYVNLHLNLYLKLRYFCDREIACTKNCFPNRIIRAMSQAHCAKRLA